ncbi:MAG: hypothetical protein V7K61_09450 [Nostoc sp.]
MKIIDRKDAINHHKDAINRRLYNISLLYRRRFIASLDLGELAYYS